MKFIRSMFGVAIVLLASKVPAVDFAGQQTGTTEWTYTLTFAPLDNYSIFQANTTITLTGLFGVTGAEGPTSTDFPAPHIDAVNTNWTAEVLDGGTAVRWTHLGPGTGNFGTVQHAFGFRVFATGATDGLVSFTTSGFSRDTSNPLPDGSFDVDVTGSVAGPTRVIVDSDGDGVIDGQDQCPNTPPDVVVDGNGCSIDQLVPCAGPRTGGAWKNHGRYVSDVARVTGAFLEAGLIDEEEAERIVCAAARSNCGKK